MTANIYIGLLFLVIAITMTMVGKGGGNFYVLILALAQIPMHEAATTGQFVLFSASVAAMLLYQKNKVVAWPLAFAVGGFMAVSALAGGYFSHYFTGFLLKVIFACLLVISGVIMLLPISGNDMRKKENRLGYWALKIEDEVHIVNLWVVVPVTILTGFFSGMVGVSGGSFLVPLMVLACGVSMRVAVGTASSLIAVTAFMGFIGHASQGDFNSGIAIPLAIVTIFGGVIGVKYALKTKPKNLKRIFAYTNWLAAAFMVLNAYSSM